MTPYHWSQMVKEFTRQSQVLLDTKIYHTKINKDMETVFVFCWHKAWENFPEISLAVLRSNNDGYLGEEKHVGPSQQSLDVAACFVGAQSVGVFSNVASLVILNKTHLMIRRDAWSFPTSYSENHKLDILVRCLCFKCEMYAGVEPLNILQKGDLFVCGHDVSKKRSGSPQLRQGENLQLALQWSFKLQQQQQQQQQQHVIPWLIVVASPKLDCIVFMFSFFWSTRYICIIAFIYMYTHVYVCMIFHVLS